MKVYELINLLLEMPAGADVQIGGDINVIDMAHSKAIQKEEFNMLMPIEDCYCEHNTCVIEW